MRVRIGQGDRFWPDSALNREVAYLNYLDGAMNQSMHEAKCRNLERMFRNTSLHRESWEHGASELFDRRYVSFIETEILPAVSAD